VSVYNTHFEAKAVIPYNIQIQPHNVSLTQLNLQRELTDGLVSWYGDSNIRAACTSGRGVVDEPYSGRIHPVHLVSQGDAATAPQL